LDDNKNIKLELQFYTILSINPQPGSKNQHPILIGIIIAVLLIESMCKLHRPQVDRRFTMNQVVLLTDRSEECETLISCLKILFPECEVQVQPNQAAKLQRTSLALEPSTSKK
jgi:hypothetical protein